MEGGALRPWEKLYWGVFVVAISALLFGRLRTPAPAPPAPELEEAKSAAKAERARAVAAGGSVTQGEDDPFDGLVPEVRRGRRPRPGEGGNGRAVLLCWDAGAQLMTRSGEFRFRLRILR